MTEKIALARRMRALAGRETTDVNTTRGIAIVTRMRLARANGMCIHSEMRREGILQRKPDLRFEHRYRRRACPGAVKKRTKTNTNMCG